MKRVFKGVVLVLFLAGAIALLNHATVWLIDASRDRLKRSIESINRELMRNGDLIGLFTFDEPIPREWVNNASVLAPGTVCKPARFGSGRAFDGRERTHIDTSLRWQALGNRFTLVMWVMLKKKPPSQTIFFSGGSSCPAGFRLQGGDLTFDVPARKRQVVSYPFKRYGESVCLAATVDAEAGTVMLYENGKRMASNDVHTVSWSRLNMSFGKPVWYATQQPFHGLLDEVVMLKRALSSDEILHLSRAHHGFLRNFISSRRYYRWQLARKRLQAAEFIYKLCNVFSAPVRRLFPENRCDTRLPTLTLHLTDEDMRRFLGAHHRSRLSGRRIQAAARSRRVHVGLKGRVSEADLHLAGSDITYATSPRPSFVLEFPPSASCFGTSRLQLQPPESCGYVQGFLVDRLRRRFGLPVITNGFCRLKVNGNDFGNYIFFDYACNGIIPGDDPDIATGYVHDMNDFRSLFKASANCHLDRTIRQHVWPLTSDELLAMYDEVASEIEPLIAQDASYPEGLALLHRRIQRDRQRVAEEWPAASADLSPGQRWADFINPFQILGDNLSPDRITEALNLDLPPYPGVKVRWHSSQPEIVHPETGAVTRPAGKNPVVVKLTARVKDKHGQVEKVLSLRVMPETIALPALLFYIEEPVVKTRRVEATIDICQEREDVPSQRLRATQGRRGGINHRGNSSYWSPKRLFTIKFDEPHGFFGDTNRHTVVTINALQDWLFLNNKIAFDLFRDLSTPAAPRYAPYVRHAEFYVNGYYQGLYELCTRLDEDLIPVPGLIVYRHENIKPRDPPLRASRPPSRDGDFMQPFLALQRVVEQTPTNDWLHQIEQQFDLANVIDYQLLLNVTQNSNGAPFPFWCHDALIYQPLQAPPFSHVPWDFDVGFIPLPWGWLENDLMRRLMSDLPDYRQRCASRWQVWRNEVLTGATLEQKMSELAETLMPYIEHDYRRWQYGDPDTLEEALERKRALARRNLFKMDRYLGLSIDAE